MAGQGIGVTSDEDEFLIDEGADPAEGAEEEDLLADVERPAGAAWDWADDAPPPPPVLASESEGEESDAFLAQGADPTAQPGAASSALDDLFAPVPATSMAVDVDQGPSMDDLLVDESPPPVQGVPVLLVDPVGSMDGPTAGALSMLGFDVSVVETGAAAREAIEAGTHQLAVLVVDGDGGWARMLMMAARDRGHDVCFVAVLTKANSAVAQQLRGAGATSVAEGLASPEQLLAILQGAAPSMFPGMAGTAALAAELKAMQDQMAARMAESEERARDAEARAEQASAAAQLREREITGVRSELTGLRQRCELLDGKAKAAEEEARRLREQLAVMQRNVQAAEGQAAAAQTATAAAQAASARAAEELQKLTAEMAARPAADPGVAKLKQLAAALGPYGVAVDQALEFLATAAKHAAHGTPAEWQRHIKNMTLTRQIMRKLEVQARGEPPT